MLGCHDFCGYYEWTFHYMRRRHGQDAVKKLWAEAIGGESQSHYADNGGERGLRGLYDLWVATGEDEQCDWTFTLDEASNTLRWDMRECPSKGFLLKNDLNADEDYCDHCMGWIVPLLNRIGIEVTGHQHNHCGQCWAEMSVRGRPHRTIETDADIRRDARWKRGFIETWQNGQKQPLVGSAGEPADPCDVLEQWFADAERILAFGAGRGAWDEDTGDATLAALVVTDAAYLDGGTLPVEPRGVLIGQAPVDLAEVANRFNATPPEQRPLLMHTYLPSVEPLDFASAGLPRPVPILPLLIRKGIYVHRPGGPHPGGDVFLAMLAIALAKPAMLSALRLTGGAVTLREMLDRAKCSAKLPADLDLGSAEP
jgi:hypothetical protein